MSDKSNENEEYFDQEKDGNLMVFTRPNDDFNIEFEDKSHDKDIFDNAVF